MKNSQKGFLMPLLIIILAVVAIGSGIYYNYSKNNVDKSTNISTDDGAYTVITFKPNTTLEQANKEFKSIGLTLPQDILENKSTTEIYISSSKNVSTDEENRLKNDASISSIAKLLNLTLYNRGSNTSSGVVSSSNIDGDFCIANCNNPKKTVSNNIISTSTNSSYQIYLKKPMDRKEVSTWLNINYSDFFDFAAKAFPFQISFSESITYRDGTKGVSKSIIPNPWGEGSGVPIKVPESSLVKIKKLPSVQSAFRGFVQGLESKPVTKNSPPPAVLSDILTSKEDQVAFEKLVGKYEQDFIDSSQMIYSGEDAGKDLDGFSAQIQTGGVRGLYTLMENIIMISPKGEIYAAVIDDNKVRYFTNSVQYKNKLPKTIDNWRQTFIKKEIIYMNAGQ